MTNEPSAANPKDTFVSTMACRLTAPVPAAIATIGVRGPRATELIVALTGAAGPSIANLSPGSFRYRHFGRPLRDDVVIVRVAGEPNAEWRIHCHGGNAMVEMLLADLANEGAAIVSWSEFAESRGESRIRVDAREALSRCRTSRSAAILLDQWSGLLESSFDSASRDPKLAERLLGWSSLGLRLVSGWKAAFFGRPNVGKSSLINALAGYTRSIVHSTPGTTRDVLRIAWAWDGWPFELIDGAGLRDTQDPIEQEASSRLKAALKESDLRVLVIDASVGWTEEDLMLARIHEPNLVIANKTDLLPAGETSRLPRVDVTCSARVGEGVREVACALAANAIPAPPEPGEAIPFTIQQVDWLRSIVPTRDAPRGH